MANRYNQFVASQYIGLPVDYYQMALGAKEQQNQQSLQNTTLAIDAANGIDAIANPDKELKKSLMADLEQKIGEFSKKNLGLKETMMGLNRIVNDRDLSDKLVNIQKNSTNITAAFAKEAEYRKKYGNDINTQRLRDEWTTYNKQNKDGFQSNFLAGYEPDAFVDIVGDMQKVLEKEGANSKDITYDKGKWLVTVKGKQRDLTELMKDAGVMMDDPKYQTQLQNLLYYNASRLGGGNIQKGYDVNKTNYLTNLDDYIVKLQGLIPEYSVPGKEKELAEIKDELKSNQEKRNQAASMNPDALMYSSFKNDIARIAASPFDYKEESVDMKANPYSLANYNSSLTLGRQITMFNKHKQFEKEKIVLEGIINTANPTIMNLPLGVNANGETAYRSSFVFADQGGFKPAEMVNTLLAAGTNQKIMDERNKEVAFSAISKETLKKDVADGKAIPGFDFMTKRYYVSVPGSKKTYFFQPDTETANNPVVQTMNDIMSYRSSFQGSATSKPVVSGYGNDRTMTLPTMNIKNNMIHGKLPLDGVNEYDVLISGDNTKKTVYMLKPPVPNGVQGFQKTTGVTLSLPDQNKYGDVVFYWYTGKNKAGKTTSGVTTDPEMKGLDIDPASIRQHAFIRKGDAIYPVENVPVAPDFSNITQMASKYLSNPGKPWSQIRKKETNQKTKSSFQWEEGEQESSPVNQ